jgi:putative inorganic carbon (HCO3(-)) transporter
VAVERHTDLPRRRDPLNGDSVRMISTQWIGIGLIGAGVLWESLLAPNLIGWGFVLVGFPVMLLPERQRPIRTPVDWLLLALIVTAGLSLSVTALPEVTRVQVMRLGAGLVGFYGLVNWARDRVKLTQAAVILVVSGMGLALVAPFIVDWTRAMSVPIPSFVYKPFVLLVPDSVHPNVMAALMVLLLPLPLAWFLSAGTSSPKRMGSDKRIALGAASLAMVVILLLTKSRGGYIAGAVGGLMVIWLSGQKTWALGFTLLVTGLGTCLIIVMNNQAPELVQQATDPANWVFRQQVWQVALQMMVDFPFTGVGMGTFNHLGSALYAFRETLNPGAHNLYLQSGLDLGFPGLIAYLSTLMLTLWMAVVAIRRFGRSGNRELRALATGALAGMLALMVHGLVQIAAWGTRAAFVPWLMIGLTTALYQWAVANAGEEHRERGQSSNKLDVPQAPATIQRDVPDTDVPRQKK